MSDIAIRVEHLYKQYRLGEREPYKSLREVLARAAAVPFKRRNGKGKEDPGTIWALDDVSFEVKQGEAVGIIGRNGAGKSTLLKVLSRITKPTRGRATIYGRVGSLLEVGTGFHPELTGRENIYLNGAILGMKRHEITRKFEEIVDFAEIEQFLDTPVKRYSSGMYVRLAFAVAAHLEPEILLVDEVLAVGDAGFQKKCLGKMGDITGAGRTVIFISHNMEAVTRLCSRAMLLEKGGILNQGSAIEITNLFLQADWHAASERIWPDISQAPGNEVVRLTKVHVCTQNANAVTTIDIRQPVGIEMEYDVLEPGHILNPNLHFINDKGITLFVSIDLDSVWRQKKRPIGHFRSTAWVPGNYLAEGWMLISAAITTFDPWRVHLHVNEVIAFQVIDNMSGDSVRGDYHGQLPGVIRPLLNWTTQQDDINMTREQI